MLLTLVEGGEIYSPESQGLQSILIAGERIAQIGQIDVQALAKTQIDCDVIDAKNLIIVPGLIDPHTHLCGAGGEQGFASRMPEVSFDSLVNAGITTVVGLIGTDVIARSLNTLLARAQQINAQGLTAFMYTGGFSVPPATITGSVQNDIVLIDRVIGVGEIAISDERSSSPSLQELARIVSSASIGGKIAGKAGVVHFHTGEGEARLSLLRDLLKGYDIAPKSLYIGHISRTQELLHDGIEMAKRGAFVDMDTIEEDTVKWLPYYLDHGGPPDRVTVSSDSHTPGGIPEKFYNQFVKCAQTLGLEKTLPAFTRNTANVLKFERKGDIREGMDADLLLLKRDTFEIVHVIARGQMVSKRSL